MSINSSITSKQAYLAANYMSGTKADAILSRAEPSGSGSLNKQKKKKKQRAPNHEAQRSEALAIRDDSEAAWSMVEAQANDDVEEVVVTSDRSFKKRKAESHPDNGGGWIRASSPPPTQEPSFDPPQPNQGDPKPHGGVLTKAQLAAMKAKTSSQGVVEPQEETVYRDASGRRIDTKAERAAEARARRLKEEKEASKMEWGKGFVQREEEDRLRKELELERTRNFSRCVLDLDIRMHLLIIMWKACRRSGAKQPAKARITME